MQDAIVTASSNPQTEQPSETIVRLIADREGISPTGLSPPLYSAIDPDALNSLFDDSSSEGTQTMRSLCFQYCGYDIVVEGGGDITIAEINNES